MNKFVIAAVAATLLASTSAYAEGDSGRDTYQSAQSFYTQQSIASPANAVRDARAQDVKGRQAVKSFTADEAAWFARATVPTAQ